MGKDLGTVTAVHEEGGSVVSVDIRFDDGRQQHSLDVETHEIVLTQPEVTEEEKNITKQLLEEAVEKITKREDALNAEANKEATESSSIDRAQTDRTDEMESDGI